MTTNFCRSQILEQAQAERHHEICGNAAVRSLEDIFGAGNIAIPLSKFHSAF